MPAPDSLALAGMYPGSKQKVGGSVGRAIPDKICLPAPYVNYRLEVGHPLTPCWSIGQLARLLHKTPGTLREWERTGILPRTYLTYSRNPAKAKRLYTREQMEGLIRIATDEGMLRPEKPLRPQQTKFAERAEALFTELMSDG